MKKRIFNLVLIVLILGLVLSMVGCQIIKLPEEPPKQEPPTDSENPKEPTNPNPEEPKDPTNPNPEEPKDPTSPAPEDPIAGFWKVDSIKINTQDIDYPNCRWIGSEDGNPEKVWQIIEQIYMRAENGKMMYYSVITYDGYDDSFKDVKDVPAEGVYCAKDYATYQVQGSTIIMKTDRMNDLLVEGNFEINGNTVMLNIPNLTLTYELSRSTEEIDEAGVILVSYEDGHDWIEYLEELVNLGKNP